MIKFNDLPNDLQEKIINTCFDCEDDLHDTILDILKDYPDDAEEIAVETKKLFNEFFEAVKDSFTPTYEPPLRVEVWDGAVEKRLGFGTYICDVDVYIVRMPDGSLQSNINAEKEPEVPEGGSLEKIPDNPKIKLDDGRVVYGCQVWWKPLEEKINE